MKKPIVIGIGNAYRGDDAIGLLVAESLKKNLTPDADIAFCQNDAMDLMQMWEGKEAVFLIDAVVSGTKHCGFLHTFNPLEEGIPAIFSNASTHALDVAQAIELSRALDTLPKSLIFYGIEGKDFSLETGISEKLKKKLKKINEAVEAAIRRHLACMK